MARARRIGLAGLLVTLVILLAITLKPTPVDQGLSQWVAKTLAILHQMGMPHAFGYDQLEFTANIIMFVPLGVFLILSLPTRHQWIGFIALPALSGAIELIQFVLLPGRYATILDVLANSIGAWLGLTVTILLTTAREARREPAE